MLDICMKRQEEKGTLGILVRVTRRQYGEGR